MASVTFTVYDNNAKYMVTIYDTEEKVDKILDEFDIGNESIHALERLIKSTGSKYEIKKIYDLYDFRKTIMEEE